ncbi:MAG: biotin/lipoyl-binding protein [Tidjanibacter sp.]|jgi:biotin carboxyl carrier protein|nr:biotin/lipoyl-binding protein [Tidjanibacter sp.]MBQ1963804.1 biotin/lipoyl-binding protein [Tidjanibacter sp.]MBQ5931997.1 biotin/lipoyl-binding protein [Tidjanibacter sp.]
MKNYNLKINDNEYNVQLDKLDHLSKQARVIVNGTEYIVEVEGLKPQPTKKPQVAAATYSAAPATAAPAAAAPVAPKAASAAGSKITSPLPGTVLSINVAVGDNVTAGQTVAVLEAMKMENNIAADKAGVVKEICVNKGASVMEGDALIILG